MKPESSFQKKSFLQRAKEFCSEKKTQIIGGAILAGAMALTSCAIPLEKKVITPNAFMSGRLVTLTGEVMEGYKDTNLRSDLNIPLVIYNSVDSSGENLLVNIHEDFRFGLNTQAIKRMKEALNNGKYAVRVYGRTTHDNMIYEINGVNKEVKNVDSSVISLTDKDGEVKLILEMDLDPIVALMDPRNITMPINVNPGISWGIQAWPWNFGFGSYWNSMDWFDWMGAWGYGGPFFVNYWSIMAMDFDRDGIPNWLDPFPYDLANASNRQLVNPELRKYQNVYAGLNLHNYLAAMKGEKNQMIPPEGARLHKDFVDILARNNQADEYRAQIITKRQELIKNYNSKPANERARIVNPASLESIVKSIGIRLDQTNKSYNNPNVRTPGMIYERGTGVTDMGSMRGESEGGSSGYAIPRADSSSRSASSDAGASGTKADSGGDHIKK